jgi:signal peptidase I
VRTPLFVAAVTGTVAAALLVLRRKWVVVEVQGPSMQPTLVHGDRVLVRRTDAAPRGAVVVLRGPQLPAVPLHGNGWMIKRVAAVAGDPMSLEVARVAGFRDDAPVPAGHVVVYGDNPAASSDSRHWGPMPTDGLLGVVVRRMRLLGTGGPSGVDRASTGLVDPVIAHPTAASRVPDGAFEGE